MKKRIEFWSIKQEDINKNKKPLKYNVAENINSESKKQFHAKQSYKRLYSNNWFELKTEIKEKKNSRFSRNKILRERYLQRLSENRRENNEINYKNSEEFFQLLNNQTFFDGNFTVIEKIERRLDVIICRLGWAHSLTQAQHLVKTGQITISSKGPIKGEDMKRNIPVGSVLKRKRIQKEINKEKEWICSYLLKSFNEHEESAILLRQPSEKEVLKFWWLNSLEVQNDKKKLLIENLIKLNDKLNLSTK